MSLGHAQKEISVFGANFVDVLRSHGEKIPFSFIIARPFCICQENFGKSEPENKKPSKSRTTQQYNYITIFFVCKEVIVQKS
jgi:hypothetical protein